MPDEAVSIDRAAIRRLVEDHWRSLILFGRHMGETHPSADPEEFRDAFVNFGREFDERNIATATLMPREQADMFMRTVC